MVNSYNSLKGFFIRTSRTFRRTIALGGMSLLLAGSLVGCGDKDADMPADKPADKPAEGGDAGQGEGDKKPVEGDKPAEGKPEAPAGGAKPAE